jgi:hypothetical protein
MMMLTAGIQNAFVQVCFKFYGEIKFTKTEETNSAFTSSLLVIGCVFGGV